MNDFFAPRKGISPEQSEILKQAVRSRFHPPDSATIKLMELRCTEEGCPPLETVIAILDETENRQYKIHKGIAELTVADIASLTEHADHDHPA
ncbi:MAG: hypothetical protein FJW30_25305 [Acidobacteria bacterium]|nr:hypothetical protein [Acidobacteriota bacterium]MBM3787687.1 hypothetical protein [Acidobacteriota bacterium]